MRRPRVIFSSKLSPFELAFYDTDTGIIYIDSRLCTSSLLPKLLLHERAHAASTKLFDADVELQKGFSFRDFRTALGVKPLWFFCAFMPFVWVRTDRLVWGVDLLRLVTMAVIVDLLFVLIWAK